MTRSNRIPMKPRAPAADAVASPADTNFTIQVNKIANGSNPTACAQIDVSASENSIPRAELQLAGDIRDDTQQPYPNEAAGTSGGRRGQPGRYQFHHPSE